MPSWIFPWNGRTRFGRLMGWNSAAFLAAATGSLAIDQLTNIALTLICTQTLLMLTWCAQSIAEMRRIRHNLTILEKVQRGDMPYHQMPGELQEELNVSRARTRLQRNT